MTAAHNSTLLPLHLLLIAGLGTGCISSGVLGGGGSADDDDTADDDDSVDDDDDIGDDDDTANDDDTADDDDDDNAIDCSAINPLPVQYETVSGIVSAEDFVFGEDGGVFSIDPSGNLVRSDRDVGTVLVAPGVTTAETAGISMLPGGDLVVADVGAGAVVRVTQEGGVTTLLSGLGYPNGLEVHRDGWVAVAEQDSGQLRRVDADTGEFVMLATGLNAPNGVSFSTDYNTVYVNSFGGGTVTAVDLGPDGPISDPWLFGEVGDGGGDAPPWGFDPWSDACQGLSGGDECLLIDQVGECQDWGGGDVWCDAPDPFTNACSGLNDGDTCTLMTESGVCQDFGFGDLYCDNPDWWGWGEGGALDGIGVDGCDNVYVSDFGAGQVLRWTSEGEGPEVVAELPEFWIPNMDFGVGRGGWDATKLWVVTRDGDQIFGLDIGIPGRPLAHLQD